MISEYHRHPVVEDDMDRISGVQERLHSNDFVPKHLLLVLPELVLVDKLLVGNKRAAGIAWEVALALMEFGTVLVK